MNHLTEACVARILSEHFGVDMGVVTPSTTLKDLDADSLDRVELVMALEDEFDIEITDEEAEPLVTVGQIIDCVKGKVRV